MFRRLVRVVTALAVVTVPALTVVAPPAQARPSYNVSTPTTFSPNGDGVQDTLRVRYTVPKPTRVREPERDIPQRAPGAAWSFATTGTDSVDVASFTVDVRYLAVAD